MLNLWKVATKSLSHYWRSNFMIALGVAAATAVLTGALIVGDSMRTSLRNLSLDRLGQIDEMLVSDGFFRSELAVELSESDAFKEHYSKAVPVILFPNGTVEFETSLADGDPWLSRASNVNIIGFGAEFWSLGSGADDGPVERSISGDQVIINRALAQQLGVSDLAILAPGVTVRIPKPTQLPADSALGKKRDLIESLVELEVVEIVENEGLGRFGLHPSQIDSPNIYLPIQTLQESLCRSSLKHKDEPFVCNCIFLAGKDSKSPPAAEATEKLKDALRPSMKDFGLSVKQVQQGVGEQPPVFEYFSLSSDRLVVPDDVVAAMDSVAKDAKPVFTYLAKDIRLEADDSGVPFSMVSAIDFDSSFQLIDVNDEPIKPLAENEIVLNEWAAANIKAKVGDLIAVVYFEPETTHGDQVESEAQFTLVAIAKLTEPLDPFSVRRDVVRPAGFDKPPTLANDPDLTPEVPGVTDAATIDSWDLPFKTDGLRPEDDSYWNEYRTTPKAFVNLKKGRELWGSRFGETTSLRVPKSTGDAEEISDGLLARLHANKSLLGFEVVPVKRNALAASSGSTPFDALFLALSMFVIASALILVSLLFRLAFQQRAAEVGGLLAMGFDRKQVSRLWLSEMLLVGLIGVALGTFIGVGYAALMIHGLKTWWVGAISQPILDLHLSPLTIAIGLLISLLVCLATIWWSIRRAGKYSVRGMLNGVLDSGAAAKSKAARTSLVGWVMIGLFVVAFILVAVATQLGGEPQAGAFMGAGFMMLAALLILVYRSFAREPKNASPGDFKLSHLATLNGRRNPLRSTLTVGLVAVAAFLVVAVSSFRLSPTEEGTAGFDYIATSSQPVFADLNDPKQQAEWLGAEYKLNSETRVYSMRFKPGQDASCNNLYQSTQPQVIGVPRSFVQRFDQRETEQHFRFASTQPQNENDQKNPWQMISYRAEEGVIPVIIDKNTANYSLKIFATGGEYKVQYDSGEEVTFRVVGFLENSVLQGSLIISEENFVRAFPSVGGYRYFMIDGQQSDARLLEERLSDQGFDARDATQMLAQFQTVQNTYISTFQTLGALGLLLGTFGLAVVQIRNVLERRKELALMQSVGFTRGQLSRMVLMENSYLLLGGLVVGIVAALFATLPHYFFGSASVPWQELALLFAMIAAAGLLAAFFASRIIARMPLVESLRV